MKVSYTGEIAGPIGVAGVATIKIRLIWLITTKLWARWGAISGIADSAKVQGGVGGPKLAGIPRKICSIPNQPNQSNSR